MAEVQDEDLVQPTITDVPGVRVGQVEKIGDGWLTGVTVVIPPQGSVGAVEVRGGGPGTHETDALAPGTMVSTVDAVVLTGGSAYGLVTAHGVQRWCEDQGRGYAVDGGVVPIVPAAAIFDLGRGGDFSHRPDAEMGYQAAAAASDGAVRRGNVGAGAGAVLGQRRFKSGIGTYSTRMGGANKHIVVGAIAVVNAVGHPLGSQCITEQAQFSLGRDAESSFNTTLAVVATNATLSVAEARRMSMVGHNGIARALIPTHTLADGDTVFTIATGQEVLDDSESSAVVSLIELQALAAVAVQGAVEDGIRAAESIETPVGPLPRWPS